jgi:hypothetical protein
LARAAVSPAVCHANSTITCSSALRSSATARTELRHFREVTQRVPEGFALHETYFRPLVAAKPPPAAEKKEYLGAIGPQTPIQENFDADLPRAAVPHMLNTMDAEKGFNGSVAKRRVEDPCKSW